LLDGPAEIAWSAAELNVDIGLNGPRAVSFESTDMIAAFTLAGFSDPTIGAARAAGTLAPAADGGTAAALTFTDLSVSANDTALPPMSGSASGTLSVPPRAFLAGRAALQTPLSAHAIRIALTSGGATMQIEGDVTVNAAGVVDGSLMLRIAGADALPAFVAALPPAQQPIGNAAAGALFVFGRPTTLDGEPASEIRIEIEQGIARIGLVEVALPRLPL
jgi:hypothetical protein